MTETPPDVVAPYAAPADALLTLGPVGTRTLPAGIDVDAHVAMAHAQVMERLAEVYPNGLPTFTGVGREVVRWAEARLAGASLLDALRAHLGGDTTATATDLRVSALATLEGTIPGYPAGSGPTEPGATPRPSLPRHTSTMVGSIVADPYARHIRIVNGVPQPAPFVPPAFKLQPITQTALDALILAGADDPYTIYVIVDPE